MALPSGPGLPSPSSPAASVLFAAGGVSSSYIPLVRHCLQLWPGLSHFLPLFCPTPLLCPSSRSQPGLPHRKEEKGSHLFRRLLTYGLMPRGCREEGIMRNSCMQLTPGTGYRASDNRGRNTAKGNPVTVGPQPLQPSLSIYLTVVAPVTLPFLQVPHCCTQSLARPTDTTGQETSQESGISGRVPTRLSGGSVVSSTFFLQRTAIRTKKRKQC